MHELQDDWELIAVHVCVRECSHLHTFSIMYICVCVCIYVCNIFICTLGMFIGVDVEM